MSLSDKNAFGGGNAVSLYIPITDIEQEFLARLTESKEIMLMVHEWGFIESPRVTFGDKNLHVHFKMLFDRPDPPIGVRAFDLELKTRSGLSLFRQKMSVEYDGQPLLVGAGLEFDMVWDIAIRYIDPKVIKALMPQTLGMTSRLEDTATHEMTVTGNMNLTQDLVRKAHQLRANELLLPNLIEQARKEARQKALKKGRS
jgi:hypothetical protein